MASACCNMMRAASSNQFVAGRHADRSPLARFQLFTREIVRDFPPCGCAPMGEHASTGRPYTTAVRGRRRRAFMRRFCLDPGPYGCTKVYLRNNTVLYCTYTTSNIHDKEVGQLSTRRAVSCTSHHRPPGEALGNEAPPPRARRGRSRAEARGRGGQVGSSLVDATNSVEPTRVSNRMSSPVSRAVRAHEHARARRTRDAACRLDTNRRLRMCRRGTCDMHIRDRRCARETARADS